jgi:hypothetical protein
VEARPAGRGQRHREHGGGAAGGVELPSRGQLSESPVAEAAATCAGRQLGEVAYPEAKPEGKEKQGRGGSPMTCTEEKPGWHWKLSGGKRNGAAEGSWLLIGAGCGRSLRRGVGSPV